jgi:hypothetical protein
MRVERARCTEILLIDRLDIQSEEALALSFAALLIARYIGEERVPERESREAESKNECKSECHTERFINNQTFKKFSHAVGRDSRWRHSMETLKF